MLLFGLIISFSTPFFQAHAEEWPSIFDPLRILTLRIEIDPQVWEDIKADQNYYDPVLNIRAPCQLWVEGAETAPNSSATAITVQIRRKSDPAVPSEANPQKVSLKIDINEYVSGQNLYGVKKLSLENGAGGNGVLKEGFAMNMHRLASEAGFYGYEAGHASWMRVVVNGQYVGLYSSPEQRDKTLLRNRGMFKEKASWLYEINGGIFRDDTVNTTDSPTHAALNYYPFRGPNSPPSDFETHVQQWVDMQSMLTLASVEAFIANNDGLFTKSASNQGKNSFCADMLPSLQLRRMYLPWDLDAGFSSTTWDIFAGGGGQASQRRYQTLILQHAWFKEWYKQIFSELLDGPLSTASLNAFIDQLEPVLSPALAEDPNADVGEFNNLRNFIAARVPNIRTQIGAIIAPPVFTQQSGEITPGFQLAMTHGNTTGTSNIYYTTDGSDPRAPVIPATLAGAITAGATTYSGPVTINAGTRITARVRNVNGATVKWSNIRTIDFDIAGALSALRFTELMYHPAGNASFEDEDEFEFLELKNTGAVTLNLTDCSLDGVGFDFAPGATVPAGGFIVLVSNPVAFAMRYPGVPYHGVYIRSLSNSAEKIRLLNATGATVASVDYSSAPPWPLGADGLGYSLVPLNPAGGGADAANWRASTALHGSPGANDPAPAYGVGLVINEVVAKTSTPLEDAIEIFNPTAAAIDISGWYLSDNYNAGDPARAALKKYRIPAGTIVPAGGYRAFYEQSFNPAAANANALVPFAFSQDGEGVYLSSADGAGALTGHIIGEEFGASETNSSFGRYQTSVGVDFTILSAHSFGVANPATRTEFRTGTGAANPAPRIGPVVINEIMYEPAGGGAEFVEFCNITGGAVDLSGWKLEGAGSFVFPASTSIAANGFAVLVNTRDTTVEAFRSAHGIPGSVPVLGYGFDLQDNGEALNLKKPNIDPLRPHISVDRVRYNDKSPWPTEAAGGGPSLERFVSAGYGNEPLNWRSVEPGGSPGASNTFPYALATAISGAWKYNATGNDLGSAWRNVTYSDSAWISARGAFGFGYGSLGTIVPFGSNPAAKHITTYFRKEFTISDNPAAIVSLVLDANYDDGFILYLNGQEIIRRSMPVGGVTATTLAFAHSGGTFESIDLTAHRDKLVPGRNVLAVEVHLESPGDTDLLWDARLVYSLVELNADTDEDGMPDDWEDLYMFDKNDPADALLDSDGDGMNNRAEYDAGTDPRNSASVFRMAPAFTSGTDIHLGFHSVASKRYRVEYSATLLSESWITLANDIPGTGGIVEIIDPGALSQPARFYRAVLLPAASP